MSSNIGAGLLITRRSDGKVLMVRRAPGGSKPGYWNPPGGTVEEGETPFEGASREAREELGPLPRLEWLNDEGFWYANGPYFAFATFLAVLPKDEDSWTPSLNEENSEWGWFDPEELPQPLLPGVRAAVRDLADRTWRWKPPSLGVAYRPTFGICKAINLNPKSPFYLSAAITIFEEHSRKAASLTFLFEEHLPFDVLPPICRNRLDPELLNIHYQNLVDSDPSMVLICVDGVEPDRVIEVALEQLRGKAESEVLRSLEEAVDLQVRKCLG